MFLQIWTTVAWHGHSCNNFMAFMQMFSKHSSPELWNVSCRLIFEIQLDWKQTLFNSIPGSRHAAIPHKDWDMHIYQQHTKWFIAQVCYDQQLKLHSHLKTVQQTLHGQILRYSVWTLHSPNLTPCDFYLCGNLNDKVYKINLQQHLQWHFNNLWKIPDSEHHLLQLYWVHMVGKATFLASAAALVSIY
jgi:hypothetical protein